jgi:hypothetical protein
VRAAAAAAVAEWEKLKAEHSKTKSDEPDVAKVGPKGYTHGWVKVGEVAPKDLRVDYGDKNPEKLTVRHAKMDKPIASVRHSIRDQSYTITHADGKKVGTFGDMHRGNIALADYHNDHYAAFNRDKEPELAGYHDAVQGHRRDATETHPVGSAYEDSYVRGFQRGKDDAFVTGVDRLPAAKALDPTGETANKVGPKGYIHGWVFVGVPGLEDVVRHPEHGKGTVIAHGEKHVTVRFQSGKEHTFAVHSGPKESGHFTKRGDLEHEGPHKPKGQETAAFHIRNGDKVLGKDGEFHRVEMTLTGLDELGNRTRVFRYGDEGRIEAPRRMSPSQLSLGDRVKGADGEFHTVDSVGTAGYSDGTTVHKTYLHNGERLEGPAADHLEVQTNAPEYAPLSGSKAEQMRSWKADTEKEAVGSLPTVDEQGVEAAKIDLIRARQSLAATEAYAKGQAKKQGLTGALAKQYVGIHTEYEKNRVRAREEFLARREEDRDSGINDLVNGQGVPKRAQAMDPRRPLAVYGNKLHIENEDAMTHLHLAGMEKLPAHIHAMVASDMARNGDTSGIFVGSHPSPDQDALQHFREDGEKNKTKNDVDRRSWDQVGGVHEWGTHKTAVGYARGSWTLDQIERTEHSTARHELGHHLDNAMTRVYGSPASSQTDFRALWSRAKKTHGARANPYFFDQGDSISPAEFFAEALSVWGGEGSRADRVAKIRDDFDISQQTATQVFNHMEQVSADAKKMEGVA